MIENKVITVPNTRINIEVNFLGNPVEGKYMIWEQEVKYIIQERLEVTNGDAQGIMECKNEELIKCYEAGTNELDTFNLLFN
jgi:hypothetical protein